MADIFTDKTAKIETTRWPHGPINPQFTVPAVFRECQSLESQLHWLVGWLNHLASIDPDKLNDVIDSIDATLEDHETRITNNTTNIANTRASIIIDNRSLSFTAAALDALVGTGVSGITPTPGAKVNDTLIEVRTCTDTGKPSALIGRVTAVTPTSMTYLVLVALHDDYATLKSQIDGVDGDVTNLTTRVTKNEGDITNLGDRLTTVEGDITKINQNINNITEEIDVINVHPRIFYSTRHGEATLPAKIGDTRVINYSDIAATNGDVAINDRIFVIDYVGVARQKFCFIFFVVTSVGDSNCNARADFTLYEMTPDYTVNAVSSIVQKIYQGGTINENGTITWPTTNKVPTGNLNIYSQDTDPKSGAQIAIKTHDNPNNSDLWFK